MQSCLFVLPEPINLIINLYKSTTKLISSSSCRTYLYKHTHQLKSEKKKTIEEQQQKEKQQPQQKPQSQQKSQSQQKPQSQQSSKKILSELPSDEEEISKQQQNVDVAVEKKNQTKTNTTSSKPKSSQNKENNSEEKENKSKEKEQKPKAKKETKPKKEPQNVDLSKKKVFCEKYFFFFDLDCFVAINVVVIMWNKQKHNPEKKICK